MNNPSKRAHILVVEDDSDIRESMVDILEENGFGVTSASDGAQALSSLASNDPKPDVILLDLMMPNMNGFQFREKQLENEAYAQIPVAVLTADADAKEKSERVKAHAFLKKPLKIKALLDVIEQLLQVGRSRVP